MALPITDTFTQSSGSPQDIATYAATRTTMEGGISVPSGTALYYATGGTYNTARDNSETFSADQYAQTVFTSSMIGAGVYAGPAVRCQSGANTSYHVENNGTQYYLSKCLAGSQSVLVGPVTMAMTTGDVLRLEVTTVGGNAVLKVFRALAASPTTYVQFGSDYTDSSSPILTAGYAGFFVYGSSANVGPGTWTASNLGVAVAAVGSRRKKNTIHPGNHPGSFGSHLRTRRNKNLLTTITGTVAYTNAADTSAAQGAPTPRLGSRRLKSAVHPGAGPYNPQKFKKTRRNTTAPTGTLLGSASVTNANDSVSASGATTVSGSVSRTNANDTSAAAGSATVNGTLAATNANDSAAALGAPTVNGNLAKTNSEDASSASGNSTVNGSLAKANAADTLAASGAPVVTGSLAYTNANDTAVASGSVGSAVSGTVNYTNTNDTIAAAGKSTVTGSLAKSNAPDTLAASGASTVNGSLAKTNAADTLAASGSPVVTGSASIANAADTLAASGSVGSAVSGSANTTNANDSISASGKVGVTGSANITSQPDTCIASGTVSLIGFAAILNLADYATALGFPIVAGSLAYANANDTLVSGADSPENVNLDCPITMGLSLRGAITSNINLDGVILA